MKWCDFTFDTPAENLACDEALLGLCEDEGVETLRFWESRQPFVVVGFGNRVETEVNVEECARRRVPILRRCSGGGTVVQGPGCLNYNLTLCIPETGPLTTVTGTNELIMERNRAAMERLLGRPVSVQGHTDLAFASEAIPVIETLPETKAPPGPRQTDDIKRSIEWKKFSGNAQRRRRGALMFHGTFLHAFDVHLITTLLRFPSAAPDYRAERKHGEFVQNIPAPGEEVKRSLREAWETAAELNQIPHTHMRTLVENRYSLAVWNLCRGKLRRDS